MVARDGRQDDRQAGVFIALARAEHFGRAAEECGISQPTLSAAIRQLEDQLGVVLVVRAARYQGLTPEGQRVLEWQGASLPIHARCGRKCALRVKVSPAISGWPSSPPLSPWCGLTEPFQARHPAVTFSVTSRTSLQVLSQIENLEIDAGITYLDNEPLGRVTTVPLYSERYHLIAAAGTPCRSKRRDTEAGFGSSALPIDFRHAKPPHYQQAHGRSGC